MRRIVLLGVACLGLALLPALAQAQVIVQAGRPYMPPVIVAQPSYYVAPYSIAPSASITTYSSSYSYYSAPLVPYSTYSAPPVVTYSAPIVGYSAPIVTYGAPVLRPGVVETRTYYGYGVLRPRGVYSETRYWP
jgi:hypothetical protein